MNVDNRSLKDAAIDAFVGVALSVVIYLNKACAAAERHLTRVIQNDDLALELLDNLERIESDLDNRAPVSPAAGVDMHGKLKKIHADIATVKKGPGRDRLEKRYAHVVKRLLREVFGIDNYDAAKFI